MNFPLSSASTSAKDRKHKSVSEHYVRERKSNAQKQFAYNKLKNEKQVTLKHEHHKSNSAPKRPPQPKNINFEKKDKEGMLIDLSSPQQQTENPMQNGGAFENSFLPKMNGMSILDAPIDVPTQGYSEESVDFLDNESNKPEPPPYQSPPTYMNTYGITKQVPRYASGVAMAHNQYGNLDPFDTSHIPTSQNATIASYAYSSDATSHRYDSNFVRNQIQSASNKDLALVNRPKTNATLDLDDIVQNKMASLSPKRSPTPMTASAMTTESARMMKQLNQSDEASMMAAGKSLSDSLKVNLSSLTLNDTDDFDPQPSTSNDSNPNPKLDRAFLAELEKEIYKNDNAISNVNMKNAQTNECTTVNNKENTVNAMANAFNWLKNDFAGGNNEMTAAQIYQSTAKCPSLTQSPAKIYNNDTMKMTNYESTAGNMILSKKLYNTEINSADPNGYQMGASNASTVNDLAIYSNYGLSAAGAAAITSHNNTIAIGPHDAKLNYASTANVASDIYGSMSGDNVYDTVASSNSGYYELIQPNDSQTVIYDEVAADDLRPHRPAPGPPTLSAQQIQRRIERAQKGQSQQIYDNSNAIYANGGANSSRNHFVYEEINQKSSVMSSSDCIDPDSKETINAASSGTMKNLKIEQLLR